MYFLQYSAFASERPQARTWGAKLASCPGRHLASLRPRTVHVTIKLMKINLPAHEVRTTSRMNKKEIISFTVIAPAEFHPPVVKNVVLTLFQGHFS